MTVLFKNLRALGYVTVLFLAGGVLGIASYLAHQFLPHTRLSYTVYSLVAPSYTVAVLLIVLLFGSRPSIDAFFLLIMAISWLALAAWTSDVNGPADCFALGSSRTMTAHGTISSKAFCYQAKIIEGVSWAIFIILLLFLMFLIALTNRAQVLGWPDIWQDDILDVPWFGEYPGYPGVPFYPPNPGGPVQVTSTVPAPGAQIVGNGTVIQQQAGHSVIIWPSANGEPHRYEQRPGIVTHSTLSS
ncbi:hypothetical protein F5148DRAFT_1164550 [Russula earlei]|uniref:Uncharacterized protein n=1 Tax=Russula earlei TaxID=71964 RepID=A0ACC0UKF6_9AGAM|nr:hypothetical protein F5148DRAFT_1164550 [Russula earlei]